MRLMSIFPILALCFIPYNTFAQEATNQVLSLCNGQPCPAGACVRYPDGEFCNRALRVSGDDLPENSDFNISIPNATPAARAKIKAFLQSDRVKD